MARKWIYAVFFSAVVAGVVIGFNIWNKNVHSKIASVNTNSRTIQLAGKIIKVKIADTPELREMGLSGREGLAEDEGMLFIFDSDAKYQFWMKDMRFPIDILWLSDKGEVVDIRASVSPSTFPTVFAPNSPARYVLELRAGFTETNALKLGDIVGL